MAEWLKEMIETVNREFQQLPEWKRTSEDEIRRRPSDEEERQATTMQEPRSE